MLIWGPLRSEFLERIDRAQNAAADSLASAGVRWVSQETWNYELLQQYGQTPADYVCLLSFDGGAVPNPGLAGCGACLWMASAAEFRAECDPARLQWRSLYQSASHFGIQTNNSAEWHGLLAGLLAILRSRTVV